jgi:hypothetical protein
MHIECISRQDTCCELGFSTHTRTHTLHDDNENSSPIQPVRAARFGTATPGALHSRLPVWPASHEEPT